MLDLIEGKKGIKERIFNNLNTMIAMRSLAKGIKGQETILEVGLEVS